MAAVTASDIPEIPLLGQGDTAANPSPEPSANKMSETAAATKAPAMIAGHDTPELERGSAGAPGLAA
jgi:hypothetical protein